MTDNGRTAEEIDPFVKRVVTVKPGDVVIFRSTRSLDEDLVDQIKAELEKKMGPIPFVLIGPEIDLTVLKQSSNGQVHIA